MEATGLHDFTSTAEDELSFFKGQKLKIMSMGDDENWCTAEIADRRGMVPSNYIKIAENSWYHGKINRTEAETVLINKHEGAFLIRDSQSGEKMGAFSLSVKSRQGVEHFRIMSDESGMYFLWTKTFEFINELIQHHRSVSVSRKAEIKLIDFSQSPKAPVEPPPRRADPPMAQCVMALYDFMPTEADSLMLRAGDIITVMEQTDENWWLGQTGDRTGYFPTTYVKNYP